MKEERDFMITDSRSIPEIVNKKCSEAYSMIYNECEQKSKGRKRISFKRCMAVAACAVVAAAIAVPVMADNIPAFQNAFSFISGKTYTKDPVEKNDVAKYAKTVNMNQESECAEITMQSVYCDGSNLSVSFMLVPKTEKLKDLTSATGSISVMLDGKKLNAENQTSIDFTAGDDGNYYGIVHYSGLDVKSESALEINISNIEGINAYVMNYVEIDKGSGEYVPETTGILDGSFSFVKNVKPDTSHNRTYEVNEVQGHVTLESITVTPFMTDLKIDGIEEKESVRIKDDNGNELENIGDGTYKCVSPLKTAKSLSIEVFRLDEDGFPTEYGFDVPIEEGFADSYNVEYSIDESKVTYNPPYDEVNEKYLTELQKQYDEVKKNVTPEPVGSVISIDTEDNGKINAKITGSTVEDASDYYDQIDEDSIDWCRMVYDQETEAAEILLVTYELENPGSSQELLYFNGLEMISSDLIASGEDSTVASPLYVSYKENGGKDSYVYTFEPGETKTIILGYILPEELAEKDYYVYSECNESFDPESVLNGDAKLCRIK